MGKHYDDEILPSGVRLRYYHKGNDYAFPNESFGAWGQRYATKHEAIRALESEQKRRREREIREAYWSLKWADMEDLRKCPTCFSVVHSDDVFQHEEWHSELLRSRT